MRKKLKREKEDDSYSAHIGFFFGITFILGDVV